MIIDAGVIDLILLLVAVEAAALLGWSALRPGGLAPPDYLFNLAAGAALMLALRAALAGSGTGWIGAALSAALAMHAADLWRRVRSAHRDADAARR